MAGLYIHIPFCKQACHYCDFHFSTTRHHQTKICKSIAAEIELQQNYLAGESIETIYLGGGTPSLMTDLELDIIFQSIHKNFSIAADVETTVEANPDDLSPEKLQLLKAFGVNRLSIGVQTLDDGVLKFLNRSHNASQATSAMQKARDIGFKNISLDLIYAIPSRDSTSLSNDLEQFLQINPEHISAYSLTIEEKTVFGKWNAAKKFTPTPDEENAIQFELVMDTLSNAGYHQYEISNYARPGFISRHNSNYWKQKKYLGVGPSAHSFDGASRQANVSNNNTYLNSINKKIIPATKEWLTREDNINEYLMTTLRTVWGCDLNYLLVHHQYDLIGHQQNYIISCVESGLMKMEDNTIRLTRAGKMLADKISSDLFLIV